MLITRYFPMAMSDLLGGVINSMRKKEVMLDLSMTILEYIVATRVYKKVIYL